MTEQERADDLRASREKHLERKRKRLAAVDHDQLRQQALQQMNRDVQPSCPAEATTIVPPHPTADAAVDLGVHF